MVVKEYKFKLFEVKDGKKLEVASGSGRDIQDIERELNHYYMMYSQDGPVEIWRNYDEEEELYNKLNKGKDSININ